MKNGIIIPCYNEENRLNMDSFRSFISSHSDYQLCFVNDGSKDNTLDVLNALAAEYPAQVMVKDMANNVGKAEAVRSGVMHMIDQSRVQNIGFMDADLATGFDDFKRLVMELEQANKKVVIGSRKLNNEYDVQRSLFRKSVSYIMGLFIRFIIGMDIKDTQCGAKVFERNLAKRVFKSSFHSRWLFDMEVLIRVKNHFGQNNVMNYIKEMALKNWNEVDGSKIGIKDAIQFPLQLCQIAYIYNISPQLQETQRIIQTSLSVLNPLDNGL